MECKTFCGDCLKKHKYEKFCLGAGFIAGISSTVSLCETESSCKNPPQNLIVPEGGFKLVGPVGAEVGFAFDVKGDEDSPYGGLGVAGGIGVKATVCYYKLISTEEVGACSN